MVTKGEKTHYEVLNVSEDATEKDIREAYALLKETYEGGNAAAYSLVGSEDSRKAMEKINQAYEILRDRAKRTAYDQQLRGTAYPKVLSIDQPKGQESSLADAPSSAASGRAVRPLDSRLIILTAPHSLAAEQFRVLASRIDLLSKERTLKVIAVTSAVKGEGKTTTAANLAIALAVDFRRKVLLMEGDLQAPALHTFLGSPFRYGMSDVLVGDVDLESAVVTFFADSLSLLPGGAPRSNSAQLLGSNRLQEVIHLAADKFDYVLIDAPPVLPLADMTIYGEVVDGILLVVRIGVSRKSLIQRAVASLPSDKIVGTVANDTQAFLTDN